jgi:hypothetical protein
MPVDLGRTLPAAISSESSSRSLAVTCACTMAMLLPPRSGNTKVHLCSRSATDPSQRRQTVTHRQRTPQPEPTSPHWQRDLRAETHVA